MKGKQENLLAKFSKKLKIKKGDPVMVIAGKYKGKKGKVLELDCIKDRATVEGIHIQKKTLKKSQENPSGGIIEREAPIHISNIMYLENDKPTRIGFKIENGKKIRVSKKTGNPLD